MTGWPQELSSDRRGKQISPMPFAFVSWHVGWLNAIASCFFVVCCGI